MPRCSNIPLPHLKKALRSYIEKTGRRVSFEYLLIKGVTDTEENLAALIDFCDGLLCHVNLLSVNEVEGSLYKPSSTATQQRWVKELKSAGKEATIRNSRGSEYRRSLRSTENKNVENRKIGTGTRSLPNNQGPAYDETRERGPGFVHCGASGNLVPVPIFPLATLQ